MRKKILISVLIGLLALTLSAKAQYFGKNMVMYRHVQWKIYESSHFEIYFYIPNEESLTKEEKLEYLAETINYAETAYNQISKAIDYEMPIGKKKGEHKKPRLFFFWGRKDATNNPLGPSGAIAYAEPTKMRLISVSKEFPPEKNQQIITHEVCHLFQYSLWNLAEKSPTSLMRVWRRFLTFIFEGFSQHVSELHRTEPNAQLIVKYFLYYRVLNFLDVKDWVRFHNAYEVAYVLAGYLYDYIHETYGENTFQNFVKEFRRAKPMAQGFEKVIFQVLKTDFAELDRNFKKYLESQCAIPADAKEAYEYGRDILVQRKLLKPKQKPNAVYEPVASPSGDLAAAFIVKGDNVRVALISVKDGTIIKELTNGYSLYKYGLYPIVDLDGAGRALSYSQDNNSILYFAQTAGKYPILVKINIVTGKAEKEIREVDYDAENKKIRTRDPITGIYTEISTDEPTTKKVDTTFEDKLLSKKIKKIEIELDDPESPEISRDGKTIIFSAIKSGQRDIFSMNLETKKVENLTNDEQFDYGPSFAPDEKTITYVADVNGYKKLFMLNVETLEKIQLTFGPSNEIRPIYSKDGTIYFISDQDNKTKNIYSLNLENNKVTKWTNVINGVRTVVPIADKRIIFGAVGYRDSRHIFSDNLYEMDLDKTEPVASTNDLLEYKQVETPKKPQVDIEDIDPEKIKKYNPWKNIYLDQAMFYGGTDSRFGIFGYGYAYLTNLDFSKHIQVNILTFGKYYQQNTVSFFDISQRLWWGATAAFENHYSYPWFVSWGYNPYGRPQMDEVLYNLRFKRTKLDLAVQYPLDLCHRIELSLSGASIKYTYPDWKYWADDYTAQIESILNDPVVWQKYPEEEIIAYLEYLKARRDEYELRSNFIKKYTNNGKFATLSLGFIRDTALFKQHVGPFANDMYRVDLGWSTGGHNITITAEGRKYFRLGSEWVFAVRGYGGIQWGKTITPWIVGDLGELRGYGWMQFMGNQILLANFELRFLLTKYFNLFGIYLGDIRAALFMDLCKIGFDDKRFNALNKDDVNSTDTKGSLGIDFEIGTIPILGIPAHLAIAKRMKSVKFLPKLEDKWQVKFYFGIKF